MSCVLTSREGVPNTSATAPIGVVNARPAIRDPVTLGNRIPDQAASGPHSVSDHVRVRSMYRWIRVRPVVPRTRTANWDPSRPRT